jgi:Transposase.
MDGYTDVPPDGFAGRLEVRGSVGSAALEKARIASERYRPRVHVADVARRCGTTWRQIQEWRRHLTTDLLGLPAEVRAPPVLAAVVVEPEIARSAPAANSEGAVVELVMEGMTIRAGQDVDHGPDDPGGPHGGAMIAPNGQPRVFVATRPIDFRGARTGWRSRCRRS